MVRTRHAGLPGGGCLLGTLRSRLSLSDSSTHLDAVASKEYHRLWMRAYRAKNPAYQEQRREYLQRNREKIRAQRKSWAEANRERLAENQRRYLAAHPGLAYDVVKRWRERNPEQLGIQIGRRRAVKMAAFVEDVDPAAVYLRDRGQCGICRTFVEKKDASIDHIIPLARGGKHSYGNVQIAHRRCNSAKGARIYAS